MESIKNAFKSVADGLIDGIKGLFVPSEDYFDAKLADIKSKFGFVGSVIDTVNVFRNFFENNNFMEPPVITVNLSSAQGKYNYGTNAKAIDFAWYAPYKSSVDGLISSILWLVFLWNVFKALPGIINGVGSGGVASAKLGRMEGGEDD